MSLSPQALVKGLVSRILPTSNPDGINNDIAFRQGTYGEAMTMPLVRKSHTLADEGTYFVGQNAQTAAAMTTTAAFSATAPFILVYNNNAVGGRNIYLDYVNLLCTTAGTAAGGLTYTGAVVVIDTGNRYSTGGTQITSINSTNMNLTNVSSGAVMYYGAFTATAATGNARTVVALRNARTALSATVATVVGDNILFNFGGVEAATQGNQSITAGVANMIPISCPNVVIGPNQSALVYLFYAASTTPVAAQWVPEIGIWTR